MKIKCAFCKNESNRKCLIKKTTIKLNKSRKCDDYVFDVQREINKTDRVVHTADRRDEAVSNAYSKPDVLSRFRSNVAG
jgi:hypothetical protein